MKGPVLVRQGFFVHGARNGDWFELVQQGTRDVRREAYYENGVLLQPWRYYRNGHLLPDFTLCVVDSRTGSALDGATASVSTMYDGGFTASLQKVPGAGLPIFGAAMGRYDALVSLFNIYQEPVFELKEDGQIIRLQFDTSALSYIPYAQRATQCDAP